jgi:peptide/nickel transport system substrate-binding protein
MSGKLFKSLSLMLVAIMLLATLASCGAQPTSAPEPTTAAQPANTPTPEPTTAPEPTNTSMPAEQPTQAPAGGEVPSSKTAVVAWLATDPPSLDPHVCNDSGCHTIVRALYEALVGYKYGETEIEGVLADSWQVSSDGKEWTFKLRDGVTFSDGSPVTAEDVVYSFDRLAGIGKGPAWVLAGAYAGAEAVDANTVTIKLEKAVGPFLYMLPRAFIVNRKVVEAQATSDDPWAEKWMYDHDAGSGAFVLENWEHGVEVSVIKNTNYWDPEWPKIDRFVEREIPEPSTHRLLLEQGDVDMVMFPSVDDLDAYKSNPDLVVSEDDSLTELYIMMSMVAPPLNDVRVRKALSLAFDYQAMVDGVWLGHAVQAQGPYSRRMNFHDDTLPVYQQDLDQAAVLLKEAGYPESGPDLELLVVQGEQYEMGSAQILQEGLAQIGVNLNIVEVTWAAMVGRMQNKDNPGQMFGYYSFPAYPDPDSSMYSMFHTSQQVVGYNCSFYGDAETDGYLDTGRFSSDQAEREAAYKALQKRLVDDNVAIWLGNPNSIFVHRTWLQNYKYEPTWNQQVRADRLILDGKP